MIGTLTLPFGKPLSSPEEKAFPTQPKRSSLRRMSFAYRSPVGAAASTCEAPVEKPRVSVGRGSLYDVLRVRRDASSTEIKSAYRTLAKMYHPDCSLGTVSDGRDFIAIHKAYSTLSDPTARALYDSSLGLGSGALGLSGRTRTRRHPTRRWETDQCW